MTNLGGCGYLSLGTVVGAVLWSMLRVVQYKLEGLQPNMAPEFFVIIAPMLALPLAMIASLIHVLLSKWFAYSLRRHWFIAGIAYSTAFLGLVEPWLLVILLVANPVVARLLRGRPRDTV